MVFPLIMVAVLLISTFVGYKLINNVPSLLHTPLMSGMNALSGLTMLGAIIAAAQADTSVSRWVAYVAIVLAMVNISCGFGVTQRMMRMFKKGSGRRTTNA